VPGKYSPRLQQTPALHALSTLNVYEVVMTLAEIKRAFMSSPHFAVLGASKNQSKFGTKVGFFFLYASPERDIAVDLEMVSG